MKIAFLADPLSSFKIYKDTTFAMMTEAHTRGHSVYAFEQKDMAIHSGAVTANVARIVLTGDAHDWFRAEPAQALGLQEFDAVILRKDPPFDMEYIYVTYLLELAEAQGARVFNKPAAVRSHNEKLTITQFPQFITPTLVTSSDDRLRAFHREHKVIILKPLDGMGGTGVFKVNEDGMNLGAIIETLTDNGARTIMAQRYIPEIVAGGNGVARPLSARDVEISSTLAPILAQRGLFLVGLDVIGDCLTEVNVTSPTCFQEITQQTGFNVAGMFIDAIENSY